MPHKLSLPRFLTHKRVFIIGSFFIFLAGISLFCASFFFSITNIIIEQPLQEKQRVTADSLKGISSFFHSNILFVSTSTITKTIQTSNSTVREVTVVKQYPHTIVLKVSVYEPYALFKADNGFFVLSGNGTILQKTRTVVKNLPTISYYQKLYYNSYQSGNTITNKDVLLSLRFLQKALDLDIKLNSIDINGFNMIALYANDQKIIITTEKDVGLQEYQFETIVRQFKIEGKQFKVLDLRFDKPIIQL